MKLPVKGVSEIVLEVADMDRAVHFWSNVLGFPIVEQWKWEPGVPGYQAEQLLVVNILMCRLPGFISEEILDWVYGFLRSGLKRKEKLKVNL